MRNERIKELQDFANDFNKRLSISENKVISEQNVLFRKINNKPKIRRNRNYELNSISNTPIRSKSQFHPVNITIIIKSKLLFL
jgi:hypothetical protein